ncbi:efflux RND transporter periplasmic adaptor subunit [Dysgonomonas sp. Marseille-P4361]|uniref:efflux RND transporter periplasmic adaptor subunit n=1 Tax=Dysgonomonas sp. Marseille-P4361 TaxID=2161820 RepID=UPI000D551485|nr:efflux RND transporter periplasmic adaptor subunit [Dysgonomonas sp. Marseille-P4361]
MNKKTRIILIIIIVIFILGMALYPKIKTYISSDESIDSSPTPLSSASVSRNRPLNVNAMILQYQNLDDIVTGKGRLLPDEEVDLSFETSGKITEIFFKEGTNVKKGQLLAKINDKPLQAELKKLEAQVPLAQDRVFRQKALLAKDAVSQEAYESVNTELEKLRADIELVESRIAQTELRAPFDGIIGLRQVSEGTYASPTTIVAKLTKISPLKVEFSISEQYADIIKVGTTLNFTLDNNLTEYKGQAKVYALESNLDVETYTLGMRALFPNTGGHIQPGRSVNVEVKLREIKNTLVVPSISILAEMGRDIAYVYKDGRAQQVTLKKGMRTASSIQIIEGLNVGDTLLVTGVMQLRDGLPVVIDRFVDNEQK